MKEPPILKAEASSLDLLTLAARGQLMKARISSYTRKDGVFVKEHDDKRPAAKPKSAEERSSDAGAAAPQQVSDKTLGQTKVIDKLLEDFEYGRVQSIATGAAGGFTPDAVDYAKKALKEAVDDLPRKQKEYEQETGGKWGNPVKWGNAPKSGASSVGINTRQYMASHGKSPSGRGDWAFFMGDQKGDVGAAHFFHGTFEEASEKAKAKARELGHKTVTVGP